MLENLHNLLSSYQAYFMSIGNSLELVFWLLLLFILFTPLGKKPLERILAFLHQLISRFVKQFSQELAKNIESLREQPDWKLLMLQKSIYSLKLVVFLVVMRLCLAPLVDQEESSLLRIIFILMVIVIFRYVWNLYAVSADYILKISISDYHALQNEQQPATTASTTKINLFGKIFQVSIIILACFFISSALNLNLSALFAFGGISGIIIGLAAQETISNFFSGLILLTQKPFNVGDVIRNRSNDMMGTVMEIGWYRSVVNSFDNRKLYIPNNQLNSAVIENITSQSTRRFNFRFGVRYDDWKQIPKIRDQLLTYFKADTDICQDSTLLVRTSDLGDFSINIQVMCHTLQTDYANYMEHNERILLAILEIVEKNAAEIAFPTQVYYSINMADKNLPKTSKSS